MTQERRSSGLLKTDKSSDRERAPLLGSLPEVIDNTAQHHFEIALEGLLATLTYRRADQSFVLIHTEVPQQLGGRGLGARLVTAAVEIAATSSLTIVPECPFARSWLEKHPWGAEDLILRVPETQSRS